MKFRPLSIPYNIKASDIIVENENKLRDYIFPIHHHEQSFEHTEEKIIDDRNQKIGEANDEKNNSEDGQNDSLLSPKSTQLQAKKTSPDSFELCDSACGNVCLEQDELNNRMTHVSNPRECNQLDKAKVLSLLGPVIYPSDYALRPLSHDSSINSFFNAVNSNLMSTQAYNVCHRNPNRRKKSEYAIFQGKIFKALSPYTEKDMKIIKDSNVPHYKNHSNLSQNHDNNISDHSYLKKQEHKYDDSKREYTCWKKQIEQSIANFDMPFIPHVAKFPYTIENQQATLSSKLKSSSITKSFKDIIVPILGNVDKSLCKKSFRKKRETPLIVTSIDEKKLHSIESKKKTDYFCDTSQRQSMHLSPIKYCIIEYLSKMNRLSSRQCETLGIQNGKSYDKKDKWLLKLKSEWKRQKILRESQNVLLRNIPKRKWFESLPSTVSSRTQILKDSIRLDPSLPFPVKVSDQIERTHQSMINSEKYSYFLPDCKHIFDLIKRFSRRQKGNSNDFLQKHNNYMYDEEDFKCHHSSSTKFIENCSRKRKIRDQELFDFTFLQTSSRSFFSKDIANIGLEKPLSPMNSNLDVSSVTDPGKIFHFHFAPYIPTLIKLNIALPKNEIKRHDNKEEHCLPFQPTVNLVRRFFPPKCSQNNKVSTKLKASKSQSCRLKTIPWTNDIRFILHKSFSNNKTLFLPYPSRKKEVPYQLEKMNELIIVNNEEKKFLDTFSATEFDKEANQKKNSCEPEKPNDFVLPASLKQKHEIIDRAILTGCIQKKDSDNNLVYYGFLSGEKVPLNIYKNRYDITKNVRIMNQRNYNRDIWQIFRRCLFPPQLTEEMSKRNLMGQLSTTSTINLIFQHIFCYKMDNIFKQLQEHKSQYQLICTHLLNSKRHPYLLFDYQEKKRKFSHMCEKHTSIKRSAFLPGLTTNVCRAQTKMENIGKQHFSCLSHIEEVISPINEESLGIRVEFVHLSHKISELNLQNCSRNSGIKVQESSYFSPMMKPNIENELPTLVPKIDNLGIALTYSEKASKKEKKKRRAKRKMKKDKKKMRKKNNDKSKRKVIDVISDIKCNDIVRDNLSSVIKEKMQSNFSNDPIPQNKHLKSDREFGNNEKVESKTVDRHEYLVPLQTNDISGHISPDIGTKELQNSELNRIKPDVTSIVYNTPNGDYQQSHSPDCLPTPEYDKVYHHTVEPTNGSKSSAMISNEGNNSFYRTKEFLTPSNSTSHSFLNLSDEHVLQENIYDCTMQIDSPYQTSQLNDHIGMNCLDFNDEDRHKTMHEVTSKLSRRVVLCSENFLETYGEVVSDLARGKWMEKIFATSQYSQHQCFANLKESKESKIKCEITLCDCPLVDESGVDFELPSRTSIIVESVSLWCSDNNTADNTNNTGLNLKSDFDSHQAKSFVKRLVQLISKGRYLNIQIFLCLDIPISSEIANTISFVQNALLLPTGHLRPYLCLRYVMPDTLSFVVAETILSNKVDLSYDMNLIETLSQGVETQENARFLLSLSPTLTVLGAFECVIRYSTFSHDNLNQAKEINDAFDLQSFLCDIANSNLTKFNKLKGHTEITFQAIRQIILAVTINICDQKY